MHRALPPWEKGSLSCLCLKACGLFRDPLPVVWNRARLDTSRKQVQCHRGFFRPLISPMAKSTKYVDSLRESVMFAPAVVFGTNDEVTHYRKLAESEGKRFQRRRSLCQAAFLFFQVALGSAPGLYRQCVCEVTIERYLAFKKLGFLERQSTVSSFSFQVLFQTRINPAWVSRIQTQTRRTALRTVTETPPRYTRCVLWEVMMYPHYQSRNSAFLPFSCFLFIF